MDPVNEGVHAALHTHTGEGPRGQGLCPNPSVRDGDAAHEDGEPPEVAFPDAGPQASAAAIEAELEMCTVLATWEPWNTPSAALLQAMARTQQAREGAQYTTDIATTCERRAEAIKEIAYEEAHFANIPPSLRYQRLARIRLHGCPQWQRKHHTQDILDACNTVRGGPVSIPA